MNKKNLRTAMYDTAQQYSILGIDTPEVGIYGAWDGMKIPPDTRIRVTVVLEHIPDRQDTIELLFQDMEVLEPKGTK